MAQFEIKFPLTAGRRLVYDFDVYNHANRWVALVFRNLLCEGSWASKVGGNGPPKTQNKQPERLVFYIFFACRYSYTLLKPWGTCNFHYDRDLFLVESNTWAVVYGFCLTTKRLN